MPGSTILLADDEETLRRNLKEVLEEEGFEVIACRDGTQALKALKANEIDALVTDLRMPGVTGMELIDQAVKLAPDAVIIVITAFGEVETAVEAMKKGVRDFICKPVIFDELIFKLKRLLAQDDLLRQNRYLRETIRQTQEASEIVGRSPSMAAIGETVGRIAHTMSNVLICGDSGTGKEVIARAIHYTGVTRDKPFIAVNCGGLADTLVESELFGYRRGAFTGADTHRSGYFEAANEGTLFLDEIGNLPFASQAVLLRAIEQRAITRVGESRPRPVHIRVIAATNRDLKRATQAGEFREDLYYRLNVIEIRVPPLRERPEDIPLLAQHFLDKYNAELKTKCPGFSSEALRALTKSNWRGNVRELANVIERALIFADGRRIEESHLLLTADEDAVASSGCLDLRTATRDFERHHIAKVVTNFGNKAEAARALGIGVSSLYRKLEELDILKEATSDAAATSS